MKKQSVVLILAMAALCITAYQNCAGNAFQAEMNFASSGDLTSAQVPVCRMMDAEEVKPKLLYSWNYNVDVMPDYKQVMASPVVGDLDGDKVPEIGFVAYQNSAYSSKGVLRILNGKDGSSKFSISDDNLMPYATTSPLFVDLDADGKAEIIYLHYLGKKVIALNTNGSLRWEMPLDMTGMSITSMNNCRAGFAAADLDADGKSEIIAGNWIIAETSAKAPYLKTRLPENSNGCFTYAASLETQANSELRIVGTSGIMDKSGAYLWKYQLSGVAATADLLPDVAGVEVVVTGGGNLTIYNGVTGVVLASKQLSEHSDLICRTDASGKGIVGGGQATIGDFDGDPKTLEIAVATGKSLTVFNARGEKIAGSVTQDCSSLTTGLTSFDFNGDGKPEIIYADEQYVRIYEMDGSNNLKILWSEINPSGTLLEYPVVADVDGNGSSELIVVSNNMWADTLYSTQAEKEKTAQITGLRVFGPTVKDSWMPTRTVWNQHAYFANNVNDNLTATSSNFINGFTANAFKRNTQKGMFQATCVAQ